MGSFEVSALVRRFSVIAVVLLAAMTAVPVFATSGTLSTTAGLNGTGYWVDPGLTSLYWEVIQQGNLFHYSYTLTTPIGGISHFIVQASDSPNRLTQVQDPKINGADWSPYLVFGTWSEQNGNTGMPGSIWGMKFDAVSQFSQVQTATFDFSTPRSPVWGDFYAKDGNAGRRGLNAVWNAGFGDLGSQYRILVPDTQELAPQIPEWGSLSLGLMGIAPLALFRRRTRV